MCLIAMCCYDTEENGRTEYTRRTLDSLFNTVNFLKHRLVIVDNASCQETKDLIKNFKSKFLNKEEVHAIHTSENIGTAEAINLAWKMRDPHENAIKIDNDVVIKKSGWVDEMEEAVIREPRIGQIGLKRKDLAESPTVKDPYFRSELLFVPHEPGQRWIIIEKASHIMGTCVLHSAALLDKVGYLWQPGIYGFDDSAMSLRSKLAGFINCFLPHIEIDHIDDGSNSYTQEKQELASKVWPQYQEIAREYMQGKRSIYYNPFEK